MAMPCEITMLISTLRREWLTNPPRELLAGAVATFALIPEVIAFSFAAGVDPQVGLYGSFVIGIVIAFAGGRQAMVSAAAGSVALVAAPLVASHGLPYLLAAGLLAGALQILFGLLRLGVLMRFVCDWRKSMRKLLWVGIPFADGAKPTRIDVKHFHSQAGSIANHAGRDIFVHIHAAAPAVVYHERIVRIPPGVGIAKYFSYPPAQDVSGFIWIAAESAQKDRRRFERFAGCKARAKRAGIGIESENPIE